MESIRTVSYTHLDVYKRQVVDTMVVGQALGVGALAALGAADWLNWMILGTIQGLSLIHI